MTPSRFDEYGLTMPTLEHDGVVELFRDNPRLAVQILERIFRQPAPVHTTVRVADSSLGQLIPIEFRADLVLEVVDANGTCVLAIVLESQREVTPRKKYTWPVYGTVSRAERECDAVVMVVAVDEDVAEWAAAPIKMGPGTGEFGLAVLGPATIPRITDKQVARENIELAVLSAMAHAKDDVKDVQVVSAALEALRGIDREHAMVYYQIIWNVLRGSMQSILQQLVVARETGKVDELPEFMQELISLGFHDGEVKGFQDGEVTGFLKGEVKGEVKAVRENILRGVQRRGLALTAEQDTLIRGCSERTLLDRWFDNMFDAKTADDVFR